jgi:hypothetical protein
LAIIVLGVTTYFLRIKLLNRSFKYVKEFKPHLRLRNIDVYYQPNEAMFPKHWWKTPINANVVALDESEISRTTVILQWALNKYPTEMRLHLNQVFIMKTIQLYGAPFGGTYTAPVWNRIYIANNSYSDEFVERLFHAELSSILYKTYPEFLDQKAWIAALPRGFDYASTSRDVIALLQVGEPLEQINKDFLEQGFISHYATVMPQKSLQLIERA